MSCGDPQSCSAGRPLGARNELGGVGAGLYTPPRCLGRGARGLQPSRLDRKAIRRVEFAEAGRETGGADVKRVIGITLLLAVAAVVPGCVHRRLTIRSFPDGAVAYVDDQEVGVTPTSVAFTHYGVRTIRLEKDGYETVEVDERLDAPWYLTPPLDFFVENFWPREIRDERVVDVELPAARSVPQQEVLDRAEQTRTQTQQGLLVPATPR